MSLFSGGRMSNRDDDKEKDSGAQSGSGRPATKFMERPKPGKSQDPSQGSQEPAEGGEGGLESETPGSEPSSGEESVPGTGQTPGQSWKQGQRPQNPGQQQKKQGQSGQQGKSQEPE